MGLVKAAYPRAEFVAVDFSPVMLENLQRNFAGDPRITIVAHDLSHSLPDMGCFDAVVSSFAIHHLLDERKRSLYQEIFHSLNSGGIFCNLEHVASPTQRLHHEFLSRLQTRPNDEDPSNKLLALEIQLKWLR